MPYPKELDGQVKSLIAKYGSTDEVIRRWLQPNGMSLDEDQIVVDAWAYLLAQSKKKVNKK